MKYSSLSFLLVGLLAFTDVDAQINKKQHKALERELSRSLDEWIVDHVAYIITPEEREAWKRLGTAEEREQFIEIFWNNRDPTPDTEENEFKEEHYRRIAYANEHFASGIPGWKTDRGRVYIIHGPPDEIEAHPSGGSYQRPPEEGGGITTAYPFEKWRYHHIDDVGEDVVLEFVDSSGTGEFRLTTEPSDKDALLHVSGAGLDRSNGASMARRNQFEVLELNAAMQRAPKIGNKDLEAVVDSKILYNLLPFEVRTDFFKITDETVVAALTLQVSNKDIAFENRDGIQHGVVNIFGRISTMTRRVVQTFEDVVRVDMPAGLLPQSLDHGNVYWQALPLRPGRYRLNLVVKDVHSGNLGSLERAIVIPAFDDTTLSASSLVVSDKIEKVATKDLGKGLFVIGSTKLRPSVSSSFPRTAPLGVYLQVYNLAPSATVEYSVMRDSETVLRAGERLENLTAPKLTLEKSLPIEGLPPGRYTLQVKVTDNVSQKSITPTTTFTLR